MIGKINIPKLSIYSNTEFIKIKVHTHKEFSIVFIAKVVVIFLNRNVSKMRTNPIIHKMLTLVSVISKTTSKSKEITIFRYGNTTTIKIMSKSITVPHTCKIAPHRVNHTVHIIVKVHIVPTSLILKESRSIEKSVSIIPNLVIQLVNALKPTIIIFLNITICTRICCKFIHSITNPTLAITVATIKGNKIKTAIIINKPTIFQSESIRFIKAIIFIACCLLMRSLYMDSRTPKYPRIINSACLKRVKTTTSKISITWIICKKVNTFKTNASTTRSNTSAKRRSTTFNLYRLKT